jgi:pectin methylesterase-like acyl-CoA thioesterase
VLYRLHVVPTQTTMLFVSLSVVFVFVQAVLAASRTSPPSGALVVRAGTSNSGEYKTVQAAVNALPNDGSSKSIFIYPGTYTEQVYITRSGPLTVMHLTTFFLNMSFTIIYRSTGTLMTRPRIPKTKLLSNSTRDAIILHRTTKLARFEFTRMTSSCTT